MKNIIILVAFLMAVSVFSQQTQYQRYDVETGKVTYKKETKKETIFKTIIFKNWGATEYIVETKKEFKGKKKKKLVKEHTTIIKLDKAIIYTVDEKEKKIIQMKNYGLVLFKNKNLSDEGKRISNANGGKEVGTETILGYPCDVWVLHGSTTVMYKGVPLKTSFRKDIEIATEAKFDIAVSDVDIALPDYEIINANPWQDTEDTVDHYSTEEGQQEILDAGENAKEAAINTEKAYEDAKIITWEAWYEKYKTAKQFEDATQEELKDFYDESNKSTQDRVNERVQDRINKRINDRINHRSTIPTPRKIRKKPRIPKPW